MEIGGATGQIGDPSGRATERVLLDRQVVQSNAQKLSDLLKSIFQGNLKVQQATFLLNDNCRSQIITSGSKKYFYSISYAMWENNSESTQCSVKTQSSLESTQVLPNDIQVC